MKSKIIYISFLLFTGILYSQNVDSLFNKANTSYRNSFYEEALSDYLKIDSLGMRSTDLYYNLGNTYYKLNQIAPSIYNYERAILLDSDHQDAKHNLIYAQRMTIDAFETLPKSIFQKINESIIYPISYNTWAWISVFFAFLISVSFLIYHFAKYTRKKRLFFTLSLLSAILFLVSLSFTIKAIHHYNHDQPAIIFSHKISVKAEPNKIASEAFELHEGTKVQILESVDNWYKIKLADGKLGWLRNEAVKKLK